MSLLKKLVNEALLDLTIETRGPLLVKSGHATLSGPDLTPVRTFRSGRPQVYIPGSSLKGVLRSHFEKIVRTLNPRPGVVCDPFKRVQDLPCREENGRYFCPDYVEAFCGNKFEVRKKERLPVKLIRRQNNRDVENERSLQNLCPEKNLSNEEVYRDSCPACRLFGSTSFIGRLSIGDAYLAPGEEEKVERRDGVGIDRLTGGASNRAKFELEVVSAGVSFATRIYLRNYECWQLGALLVLLEDLQDGLIRIGSGRSRGLGAVSGKYEELTLSRIASTGREAGNEIWGLGKFLGDGSYGTSPDDALIVEKMPAPVARGIRTVRLFAGESLAELKEKARREFVRAIEGWTTGETMQWRHLRLGRAE